MTWTRKAAFSAAVFVGLILGLEVGLRIFYPTLPSLEGLGELVPVATFSAKPAQCNQPWPSPRPRGKSVWIVGDSVVRGKGVLSGESVADAIGQQYADTTVLARDGADLCWEIEMLQQHMNVATPRAVVWEIFADDLVPYLVYNKNGKSVIFPDREPSPTLRALISNSYFANLLYFLYHRQVRTTSRMVSTDRQARFQQQLSAFRSRMEEARVPVIPFLLEPAGIGRCPEQAPPDSPCTWMPEDLDLLSQLLTKASLPPLDLRGIWKDQPPQCIAEEVGAIPPAAVPIHPNAEGHRRIAEVLLPILNERIAATE